MFNLTEQTDHQECCRCDMNEEITDENIVQAAKALSSMRHLNHKECYSLIATWMALCAGMGHRSQQRMF